MTRPILLVDDHPVIAHSVAESLGRAGHSVEVLEALRTSDAKILGLARSHGDAIVLLDLNLGGRSSLPLVEPLVACGATVVLLTATGDPAVLGLAVEAGAAGIVQKSDPFDELVRAIDDVAAGRPILGPVRRDQLLAAARASRSEHRAKQSVLRELTAAERSVLAQLMSGHSARQIADNRFVSIETVRSQMKAVRRKLGARTQLQALAIARDAGFSSADGDAE